MPTSCERVPHFADQDRRHREAANPPRSASRGSPTKLPPSGLTLRAGSERRPRAPSRSRSIRQSRTFFLGSLWLSQSYRGVGLHGGVSPRRGLSFSAVQWTRRLVPCPKVVEHRSLAGSRLRRLNSDGMRFRPFCPGVSRALLRLTAAPSRARRSPPLCFLGSPRRDSALWVRSLAAHQNLFRFPRECTPAHRFALGSGSARVGVPQETPGQKGRTTSCIRIESVS